MNFINVLSWSFSQMLLKKTVTIFLLSSLINLPMVFGQTGRGAGNVKIKNDATGKTENVKLYKASFALVIGESDYTNGWQKLEGVKTDVKAVSDALAVQGFEVTRVVNPKKSELVAAIEKFINDHGYEYENRLLIYYAGHGHTQKSGAGFEQGFIVPVDAPIPTADNESAFRRLAISMDTIERYAQEVNAKHALFVFDSCFSGALITKTRSGVPPIITTKTTQPVRQFITAGADDQEVPDVSEFRKQFILGFQGEADRNGDDFVTASELADFLQDKVSRYTRGAQTPQYGKIRDARLDKGDFVFVIPNKKDATTIQPNAAEKTIRTQPIEKPRDVENEAWNLVKDSNDVADFREFLIDFPKGINAPLARIKIRQLEASNKTNANPNQPNVKTVGKPVNAVKLAPRKTSNGIELVWIPAGEFLMGSTEAETEKAFKELSRYDKRAGGKFFISETPQHKVTIENGFFMGKYEITQAEWESVTNRNPSYEDNCPRCPVRKISWVDAQEFIRVLNTKDREFTYSLPSEAEWEYAARAGTRTAFSFGDNAGGDRAKIHTEYPYGNAAPSPSSGKPVPVGQYQPNAFGLFDMHGNISEWCEDVYESDYKSTPTDGTANRTTTKDPNYMVFRGGSFGDYGALTRSAYRGYNWSGGVNDRYGLRIVARLRK
ncbi:MAG: SUMF1/EgtB/PvdO family nonheme iron enzyme [Pyrinomonadaceae bacterium]|nr:SUMF1/EgtB/PvdO family nonheme iron enzyme [Pyrinomonadaceae bacterium]